MYYIYIFDYTFGSIYEIAIDKEEIENLNKTKIDQLLYKYYHIKVEQVNYMTVDHKLEIERIEKQ